jgi:hypothetical protein
MSFFYVALKTIVYVTVVAPAILRQAKVTHKRC